MADFKKYKVGITVKEPWADNTSYEQLDMTLFAVENGGDGCAYVALKPNIGLRPNQNQTTWIKATQRGQSIYDYCIEYGLFVGTEEEFAQDYADAVQAAKDAAASATHVEEEVSAAEQGRVSAENDRVSAESQRASAEDSRVSYEAQRSVNETGRVNAEDSRVAAENARVVAENQRSGAESTRATNEENRMAEFGGMMRDAETAIGLVDEAMTEAENVDATVDGMIVTITDRHGVSRSVNIGFDIYRTYGSVAAMNADAANVEDGKFVMIATLDPTSTENAQLWVRNSNAATSQNPFTFLSDLDQASSAAWADWMENQKPIIEADHTTAVADHTQAVADHTNATNDHAVAGQDHTTAGTDHTQAVSDSTRARQDHLVAEQDHTRAEGDHTTASSDHSTAQSDHTTAHNDNFTAEVDHQTAVTDHGTATIDHTTASSDHSTAQSDHATATNDHQTAVSDHSTADGDHTIASADHTAAVEDNTQAASDHTRAENDNATATSDHTTAAADHTQAVSDHTTAASDHTTAVSDHAAVEVYVDSLGAYDISAAHASGGSLATYADLTAALGTNGANIPDALRKGGMSVKFVQSSDHKYIQARLMAQNFTTDIGQWQIEDDQVCGMGKLNTGSPDYNPLIVDADDAEVNRIYAISKANYVAHLPSGGQGVLQTLSYASSAVDIKLQIFVSAVTFELYWRLKWGSSYGEWNGGKTKVFEDAIDSLQRNTIPCTNGTLLDQENWINNHYLNGNNTQGEDSGFAISNYIPCVKGQTIYFTNCGKNLVLFYDENNNYISGKNTNTNAGYVIVPNVDSIAYLRFNVVKANIANGLFVSYNENDHIWNIPYGEKKYTTNDIAGLDIKVTEDVTIGTEYNTLKSALDYADTVANENHIVNILVPAGEYNVFSDIDLYSQDSSFKGLIVPDYVNIIGIGAAKDVILKAELPVDMTGYAFTRGNVSTLNLWRNNNMKNLTVIGSNMRYAIHNDTATGTAGYVEDAQEVFENCIFIGRQTDVAVNVDSSFGSCMRNGAYLKFKNCKFIIESVATESTGVTFATNFHNTANSFKTITWDFENCLFSSGYKNFAMYVTNYSGVKNGVIVLNGCKIDKRICAASQTGSRVSDYVYYGAGNAFADSRRFYTNGVDLTDEDTEMLL